jgi:hypothetical protein
MATPANIFVLADAQLHVTYSTGALGSKAGLVYQDASQTLQFNDQQMRRVSTEFGELVTVTIRMTVDTGSTTFTLVVPTVQVPGEQTVPVETIGITTIHRFSPIPALNIGQRETYTVANLRGTASAIPF